MKLDEILKKRAELQEKMKTLRDEDNKLYWKQRELEKGELVNLGAYAKIGNNIMYIHRQSLEDSIMILKGILFEIIDERECISSERYEYLYTGEISYKISGNVTIEIPIDEFRERTTGEDKDIIPLTYEQFDDELRKFKEDLESQCSIFSWIRTCITFRD